MVPRKQYRPGCNEVILGERALNRRRHPPSPGSAARTSKIVHQTGKGKGDALLAPLAGFTSDIIVMIDDGDGSTDGGEITRFVSRTRRRSQLRQGITVRQQWRQQR